MLHDNKSFDSNIGRIIYVRDLPEALKRYGIIISDRQAIEIATKRRIHFWTCPIKRLLCTSEVHIHEAICGGAVRTPEDTSPPSPSQTLKRRGRPRRIDRD